MRKNKKEATLKKGDWKRMRENKKSKKEDKNIITIEEETQIGDYVLEAGDRIEVLDEKKINESLTPQADELLTYYININSDSFSTGVDVGDALYQSSRRNTPDPYEFAEGVIRAFRNNGVID